jgi:transcription elongation factor GreA
MKARILKRLEEQVIELDRELRTELPKEIQRARELGDLSENAEYQAAKERQSYVQARMGMLRKRMAEISLMNLERLPTDRAAFGSTVELLEDNGTGKMIYQLVMPEDADATKGLISASSPIGKAIVGRQAGDQITVPTPTGVRRFELVKLTTIHDES